MHRAVRASGKVFSNHPRTWMALLFGTAISLLLPASWSTITRVLLAWDCGVILFLASIFLWMRGMSAEKILSRYMEEDPSGPIILILVTAAALASVIATVELLATLRHVAQDVRVWHSVLATTTLVLSWLLVPTMFTMHYADMFYSAPTADRPLSFPQTKMPVFWDFAYFSFTIAAANQTADVTTTTVSIRKVLIAHEIVSFIFNASIIGFAINITAGLIGG
jgi:uncharacterized membrane protein